MSVRRIAAPALIAGLMIAGLSASALADSATLSVTGRVAPTTELTVVDPTQTLRAAGTACTFVEGSITVRTNLQVSLTVAVDGAAAGDARLVLRTTEPAPGTPCTSRARRWASQPSAWTARSRPPRARRDPSGWLRPRPAPSRTWP